MAYPIILTASDAKISFFELFIQLTTSNCNGCLGYFIIAKKKMMTMKLSLKSSEPTSPWFRDFNSHGKFGIRLGCSFYIGGSFKRSHFAVANVKPGSFLIITNSLLFGGKASKKRVNIVSPDRSVTKTLDLLDAYEDEYDGAIVDPGSLPSSSNAFTSILRASLSDWKLKGKKGIWLKILVDQADLVPVAIKEGFNYHHAEPGYVMLTYWIPKEPCMLPANASHQVGVGGFVINDQKEVLVVQEKQCALRCSGVWKLPTGFIHESEEIFDGAIREVKEETGIETTFIELIAFRHAHLVAFEKSDLFFICMLRPLSSNITIDESEINAAKWMPLDEFLGQPFYQEDCMSKKMLDICIASFENRYRGFTAHQLSSKFDGKLSYLYYNNLKEVHE